MFFEGWHPPSRALYSSAPVAAKTPIYNEYDREAVRVAPGLDFAQHVFLVVEVGNARSCWGDGGILKERIGYQSF
jgi:hypothetical protein